MIPLVLASASPRRRALLAALGLEFEVITSDAPEVDHGAVPAAIVEANARAKRDDVARKLTHHAVIIAADTLVFLDEHVLSKPADQAEARAMLRRLSGNTHQVVTGLAVINTQTGQTAEGAETTDVTFRSLTDAEIHRFVDIVNPIDRAGAYTVDGPGSLLVARYDGCYQNVLGLPIVKLDKLLRTIGLHLFDHIHPHLASFL
ncbi:MAG TPA: Maf family protein [Candidatus Hydrogenedentes bacterium]|nr:Maf family protein [Candidatus Hydrogenedentota bacterium]